MSALSDLTVVVNDAVTSIDAAIAALGTINPSDGPQLTALTAQLSDAKARLDTAIKSITPASS